MRLKVLMTGGNGMLADALYPLLCQNGYNVYMTDINGIDNKVIFKMDIRDKKEIDRIAIKFKPNIIMHLAAETNVDKCELSPDHAYNTNAKGTENMALIAKMMGATLVYISTGAVFDGEKSEPYLESDEPNPISVYGKSKFEGEKIVTSLTNNYFIFRAGWMIGGYEKDKKFVEKIVELAKIKNEIHVVTDKFGSPTFTKDFSKNILTVISTKNYGLFHMVNEGCCSRFDIAKKIIEYLERKDVVIKPVTSDAFPLPAPRGRSEMLINRKLNLLGLNNMRPWQDALKEYILGIKGKNG
ncbi:MAG: dTDP-4-dehydrorhamnose reductase [Actinobacteria bacterium]|nr:dTDP-4-dehydrorhamnose reductase [Actinomycetota bacterium]